jgi:hypothetical protein
MLRVHAEHDGAEDLYLGTFDDFPSINAFIAAKDAEGGEENPWMEGCGIVATDLDTGDTWLEVGDGAWERGTDGKVVQP